jgi:hypothetical protein
MRKLGIDFHTHPLLVREMVERHPELVKAARETFFIGNNFQPLETFHLELDLAGLEKAVVLPYRRGFRYRLEQPTDRRALRDVETVDRIRQRRSAQEKRAGRAEERRSKTRTSRAEAESTHAGIFCGRPAGVSAV